MAIGTISNSNYWCAVYKQTYGKDVKFKAGYDSEVRLGWASLWVSSITEYWYSLMIRNVNMNKNYEYTG